MKKVISLADRLKQERVTDAFHAIMDSGQYAEGPYYAKAEGLLTRLYGMSTILNSCGNALYTTFKYYRKVGFRWVYLQNNSFYATGAMAIEAGLIPILIDSREDCPSMSVDSLRASHRDMGSGVVCLTHIGGWLAKDYAAIAQFAASKGMPLIEDGSHCFGLKQKVWPGLYGETVCWSFYATKAVPAGEGGAITTTNLNLHRFAQRFRNYGKHYKSGHVAYDHGMNFRMSEWDAAVLCVQLEDLGNILRARQRDAEALQSIAPCIMPDTPTVWYKYPIALNPALKTTGKVYSGTDQLMNSLAVYGQMGSSGSLQNSMRWARSHQCLPIGEGLYDGMTSKEIAEWTNESP